MSRAAALSAGLLAIALVLAATVQFAAAQSGLPLPRYASLRATKVHMRTGPGVRYPVEWVYTFRGMPVEIVAEFDNWRKIRDWQGVVGWVHRAMLSGRRTVLVIGGIQPLRSDPDPDASLIARIETRVLGNVIECEGDWCRIEIGDTRGWVSRTHVWGVYPDEKLE